MKTSEAEANGYVCPRCKGPLSQDLSEKGFVRHLERMRNGERCDYGKGERDPKPDKK
jgi:hypothetical protein